MKFKSLLVTALLSSSVVLAQAPYTPSYAPSMYRNLEKYWWYRYRLVNDFMKIGLGCGESIPLERWDLSGVVYWGDATQHLGNYINVLGTEWRLLNDNGLSTRRTEEELFYALNAFQRLDKKAEPSWRNYDQTYPYCSSSDIPSGIEESDDINGFFIRDDVPSVAAPGYNTFMQMHYQHFHRPGFFYAPTGWVGVESDYGSDVSVPGHTPGVWVKYGTGYEYARGPAEQSHDQMVMLYGGLGMTGWLLGANVTYNGWNLRERARDQLYTMYQWPLFNGCGYMSGPHNVCNKVTNRCAGNPKENCNSGGAEIGHNFVGAVEGLDNVGLPSRALTSSHPYRYSRMKSIVNSYPWYFVYQGQQHIGPGATAKGGSNDIFYSNLYAAFADNFAIQVQVKLGPIRIPIKLKNTTPQVLAKHATDQKWAWPHLPLMWQIINGGGPGSTLYFNPKEKVYHYSKSYAELFNDAPFCGGHSYDAGFPALLRPGSTTRDIGMNEDYPGQDGWQWSNGNRLQDFGKRGNSDKSDFNNLDYMTVWNLNAIVDGSRAISSMFNPYYREDYNIDYPLTASPYIGSRTQALQLNFLEYLSMINEIKSNGKLKVRGAKVIELKPGFEVKSGGVFEAHIQDYRCQEEGYVYALVNGQAAGRAANGTQADNVYEPLSFPPDGVPFQIKSTPAATNEAMVFNRSIDVVETPLAKDHNTKASNQRVIVSPNPSSGNLTITRITNDAYQIKIISTIGATVYSQTDIRSGTLAFRLPDAVPNGTYIVIVTDSNGRLQNRIILNR